MKQNEWMDVIEYVVQQTRKAGADACDAVLFSSQDLNIRQRLGQMETLERSESCGVGIRALIEGKEGYRQATVSSSDLSRNAIDAMAAQVVDMAKISPEDAYTGLAPKERLVSEVPELDLMDRNEYSEAYLLDKVAEAEDAALAVPGVTNSEGAEFSYGKADVAVATSEGFAACYDNSSMSFAVSVVAGEGTDMQTDYAYSLARHESDIKRSAELGAEAGERAVKKLNAKKKPTAQLPVIFDRREARGLVGSLERAILGSAVARGSSFLQDAMGEQIFSSSVTIYDDPLLPRAIASQPFDAEGVQGEKRAFVDNGVLQSWILDARSAKQLGLETTGHASRGLGGAPYPSASNLYMENGTVSLKELLSDIKEGFYVTETFGMGINGVTGDYSQGAAGFWIENGEITVPVSEMTIAGNLKEMFMQLTPANDLSLHYGTDAPTVRIERMTVAGS